MFHINQRAFVARTCKLAGLYPAQLLPEDPLLRKLYNIYYQALTLLHFICLASFCTELFYLVHAEAATVGDILKSISVTTLLLMTAIRQGVTRRSRDVQEMLKEAGNVEQRVYDTPEDAEVLIIFKRAGQGVFSYYLYYAVGTVFLCLGSILEPLYDKPEFVPGNATFSRKLPLPMWFPFDIQAHYWKTFCVTILVICVLVVFQVSVDVLFFYFIRSPVLQLELLHHYMRRFDYYTGRICAEREDAASNIMMRKCIDMHRKVIKFVDIFNKNFSNIMVLDFVQSSFRIAFISATIIMTESFTVTSFVFTLIFLWITLVREYYIYHAGNEIIFLSSELVRSVYETNWCEENRQFKYMVRMLLVRAGKPLSIKIGPFGSLGFPAFISILRASFSYFSLVTGSHLSY